MFSRLFCGGGCGIRTHVPCGQTVFKTVVENYLCVSFWAILSDFDFEKVKPHQGFSRQANPFEPKIRRFEPKRISKILSNIFPFCENSERTSNSNVRNISNRISQKIFEFTPNTIEQKIFLRFLKSEKARFHKDFFHLTYSIRTPVWAIRENKNTVRFKNTSLLQIM